MRSPFLTSSPTQTTSPSIRKIGRQVHLRNLLPRPRKNLGRTLVHANRWHNASWQASPQDVRHLSQSNQGQQANHRTSWRYIRQARSQEQQVGLPKPSDLLQARSQEVQVHQKVQGSLTSPNPKGGTTENNRPNIYRLFVRP